MSKDQSFAKAFAELEKITTAFEKGGLDLDEGLKQFERGLELAALLKKKLGEVENRVEVIKKKFAKAELGSEKTFAQDDHSLKGTGDTLPF